MRADDAPGLFTVGGGEGRVAVQAQHLEDHVPHRLLVLHHQHGLRPVMPFAVSRGRFLRDRVIVEARKIDFERRAGAGPAGHADGAAVPGDDVVHGRQAEASREGS